jgi:hypothetical protein
MPCATYKAESLFLCGRQFVIVHETHYPLHIISHYEFVQTLRDRCLQEPDPPKSIFLHQCSGARTGYGVLPANLSLGTG